MNKEYFESYTGWDQLDTACFQFYDPLLKQDIGDFKKGERVPCIVLDYENGKLQIFSDNGELLLEKKIKMIIE